MMISVVQALVIMHVEQNGTHTVMKPMDSAEALLNTMMPKKQLLMTSNQVVSNLVLIPIQVIMKCLWVQTKFVQTLFNCLQDLTHSNVIIQLKMIPDV